MKRIKSILLSTFLIAAAIIMSLDLCCELEEVPNLIKHYAEHKAEDGDDFWHFLAEDYLNHSDNGKDHDEQEHDNLPFHGSHQCQHFNVVYSSSSPITFATEFISVDNTPNSLNFFFSSPYLEAPLQPPQV